MMDDSGRSDLQEIIGDLLKRSRPEQLEAITSSKRLTVVSAGAGTGKTYTLANRIAWLLASDHTCRVDEILSLTFTDKAATEMRGRILATLRSWYERYPRELAHLHDAIVRIGEAYISTIHAFSMRMIREAGLDLDIDPSAVIASDTTERLFWADLEWCLREADMGRILPMLSESSRDASARIMDDIVRGDLRGFFNVYDPHVIVDLAKDACDMFGSMNMTPQDMLDRFSSERYGEIIDALREEHISKCEAIADVWDHDIAPMVIGVRDKKDTKNKFYPASIAFIEKWSGLDRSGRGTLSFVNDLFEDDRGPLGVTVTANICKEIAASLGYETLTAWKNERKVIYEISKLLAPDMPISDDEARVRSALLTLTALAWEAWDNAKRERGLLSFGDLVKHTSRVLSESPVLSQRFRHILIDEFQDTDGTQDAMITNLCSAWPKDDERLRTMFIVGDIKQSIYGFRNADPSLFARYIAKTSAGDDPSQIGMTHSSRMHIGLIEGIDAVFKSVWRNGAVTLDDGIRIDCEPLESASEIDGRPERDSDAPDEPIRMIIDIDAKKKEIQPDGSLKKRSSELRRVHLALRSLGEIATFIDGGGKVWDDASNSWRQARWGDVVFLTPTRTFYQPIEDACAQMGIKAVFAKSKKFFDRGEVRDIISFVRALASPQDAAALSSWIASPLACMDPDAAGALISMASNDSARILDEWSSRCPEDFTRFDRLRSIAAVSYPSEAIIGLLEEGDHLASYNESARRRVVANIRRGASILREYEASCGRSLDAEADLLESCLRDDASGIEPDVEADDDDTIRVMTMHASKGLEFPITVLFGLEHAPKPSTSRARVSRSLGPLPAKIIPFPSGDLDDISKVPESVSKQLFDYMNKDAERCERERLLYVAMTRARDLLICAGLSEDLTVKGRAGSLIDILIRHGGDAISIMPVSSEDEVETVRYGARRIDEVPAEEPAAPRYREQTRMTPSIAKFSASAFSLISWCPFAYRAKYRQGRELKWDLRAGDGHGGADLGSLAHAILRRWDLCRGSLDDILLLDSSPDDEERALRMLPKYLRPVFRDRSNRRVLYGWLSRFAETDVCGELRSVLERGDLQRELWFSVMHGGVELSGSIDIFWEDSDGAHIRDWKITPEGDAPDTMYGHQLELYALAFHTQFELRRVDTALIHLRPNGSVMREPLRVDHFDDISARTIAMARLAASGPFEPREDRCGVCPFAAKCDHVLQDIDPNV